MQFRPYIWGLIPNPFVHYKIDGDKAYTIHSFLGVILKSEPIHLAGANAETNIKFHVLPMGFGDITITNGANSILQWKNIFFRNDRADHINNFEKKNHQSTNDKVAKGNENTQVDKSTTSEQKNQDNIPAIPDHVEFSDTIMCLPRPPYMLQNIQYQMDFDRSLKYKWVNAGDVLGYFEFYTSAPSIWSFREPKTKKVEVTSPVSGLVLSHNNICKRGDSGEKDVDPEKQITILLPKGETRIFTADKLYQNPCNALIASLKLVKKNPNFLYFSESIKTLVNSREDIAAVATYLRDKESDIDDYKYIKVDDESWPADELNHAKNENPQYTEKLGVFNIPKIRFQSANKYFDDQDYSWASIMFDRALPHYSDTEKHAEALYQLGLGSLKNSFGDEETREAEAKKRFQRAVEINPAHAGAREKLGIPPYEGEEKPAHESSSSRMDENYDFSNKQSKDKAQKTEEAKERWDMPPTFTKDRVKKQYSNLLKIGKISRDQLDEDYDLLMEVAV